MSSERLSRFIDAQDLVLERVEAELTAGRKQSHWMWFVFPQIAGLGHSAMVQAYAIADLDEAGRYLADPVLGTRLRKHVGLLLHHRGAAIVDILGEPDDMKLRSCLTLFRAAASLPQDVSLFDDALGAFYGGQADALTARLLPPT